MKGPEYEARCREGGSYAGDEREIKIDPRVKNDNQFWANFSQQYLHITLRNSYIVDAAGEYEGPSEGSDDCESQHLSFQQQ